MRFWTAFDDGRSIGQAGAEGGVILRDEEYEMCARITLKRGANHISISCDIFGKMNHTRFFKTLADAEREYDTMKIELARIVDNIKGTTDQLQMWVEISEFVRRFE